MISIIQELLREFIRTMAWVRLCNDDEPETWHELAMSLFVCLLRTLVFLVITATVWFLIITLFSSVL